MQILVTGGAGFIGSNAVKFHLDRGDKVWTVDNLQTGQLKNILPYRHHPNFRFSEADLCYWDEINAAVLWADRIFHLAANVGQKMVLAHPISTLSNNIRGCEALLEAIDKTKANPKVLIASTSELYIHSKENGLTKENCPIKFQSGQYIQETYPVSKFVNEIMALAYTAKTGVHSTIARIFNTIGVNQCSTYGMVVPSFIEQARSGRPITIFGDGEQTRSFSDVRDTVAALSLLLDIPNSKGEIVNVGNDQECSINALAALIKELTNSSSEIHYLSYQEAYGIDNFHDVRRRMPNLEKFRALTGFTPAYTLKETIKEIITDLPQKTGERV